MSKPERFTSATGSPVPDNTNILTAGRRGPALLQDIWLIEKLAHFDREVIPERTQETGIGVKHLPTPETTLDQLDLVRKLLRQGNSTPDVSGVDVIWPGVLSEELMDLKPSLATELSSINADVAASYTVKGKLVAVPYHSDIGVLFYRRDLLRRYGYAAPPRTWGELEQMAAKIQKGERAKGQKDFWGFLWPGAAGEGLTCNGLEWQVSEGGGVSSKPTAPLA